MGKIKLFTVDDRDGTGMLISSNVAEKAVENYQNMIDQKKSFGYMYSDKKKEVILITRIVKDGSSYFVEFDILDSSLKNFFKKKDFILIPSFSGRVTGDRVWLNLEIGDIVIGAKHDQR